MIPNDDQLEAISRLRGGNLSEVPFAVLLHALAVHRRSATLEIERPPLSKSIILEQGMPVDCRSNSLHETLGRFMVARGEISEDQERECFQKAVARGIQFGEMLILEGLLTASKLYRLLQQNLAKKLLDGFTWRSGEFRLVDELPDVESPLKVNSPQLVVTGIAKFALDEEVNEAIGPLVGKTLYLHPSPPFSLTDIRLSVNQRKLADFLGPGKRIDELAAETTIPFNEIMRLLYSLAVIGVVVSEDRMPEVVPAASAPAAAEQPPEEETVPLPAMDLEPEPVPAAPTVSDEEQDALMSVYLRHRKLDAFDLLELQEGASQTNVEEKFLDYSQRFAPWKFDLPGFAGLVEKAEDVFLAGGRAFGELCDRERRNALLLRRRNLREQRQKTPTRDQFMIKSDLLDPESQFKKGRALMQAGRHHEAVQQLEFAHDCDPQNSTYRAELAYCRYLLSPTTELKDSAEKLREALRIDPKCGVAIFYSGVLQGELGNFAEAENLLRASIKMLMPDRRPIQALKELQDKQKKKKRRLF